MTRSTINKDSIGQTLDLAPFDAVGKTEVLEKPGSGDYEYARGNLISIIEKGQEALTGILDVASMSQHPRGYEVVATLINSLTAANKDLLELKKKQQELDGSIGGPRTVNNNLFVGSTAELQKLLKQKNEQE